MDTSFGTSSTSAIESDFIGMESKREHATKLCARTPAFVSQQFQDGSDQLRHIFESVPNSSVYPSFQKENWQPPSLFQRKHSIANDESSFYRHQMPSYMSLMRRGSAPQLTLPTDYNVCVGCRTALANAVMKPCMHGLCTSCAKLSRSEALQRGNWYSVVCPQCDLATTELLPLGGSPSPYDSSPMPARPQQTAGIRRLTDTMSYQYNQPKVGSDYLQPTGNANMNFSQPAGNWPCVKLSNIPWDVSQADIVNFFSCFQIPSPSVYNQAIHVMMDRTTGKTLSDAYVEFVSYNDMQCAIEQCNMRPLKGRIVGVQECSQEEFLRVVFPKWRGKFIGTTAVPPDASVLRTMSTAAGGNVSGACPPFVTREEINSLLVVCRNYKLHFSRKCAERPFENIITVVTKYPWHQAHLITTLHRDHVYEMLKLAIESLKTHLSKDYVQIDCTLLERLVRSGIMCPAFTERQKTMLLGTSGIPCPLDIMHCMMPANCFSTPTVANTINSPRQEMYEGTPAQAVSNMSSFSTFEASLPSANNMYKWKLADTGASVEDEDDALDQTLRMLTTSVANVSLEGSECTDMNFSDLDVSSRTSSSPGSEPSPIAVKYRNDICGVMAAGPLTVVKDNIWAHP
ncbi:hypothetical protein BC943DRAFT_359403 [Umbelopsis sp. AD052]|nr:hypothetical protein BC943DRAFT_359403 [Umbelopsis sp. AD052]